MLGVFLQIMIYRIEAVPVSIFMCDLVTVYLPMLYRIETEKSDFFNLENDGGTCVEMV